MKERASPTKPIVMTIGHSTRPVKEFIRLLKAHQVKRLVDVRSVPRSRHNPQFNRSELSPALHSARLHYRYMPGLGGFRRARRDSVNTGWHNASFRGFADYMQTPEFRKILDHRGIVGLDPIGALAHLQLGRVYVLSGDKPRAKPAYDAFLALWKDADSDIPILKSVKAEYAKL